MTSECRIALLIDCDNVSHQAIGGVIDELSKYGKVVNGGVKVYRRGGAKVYQLAHDGLMLF